MAIQYERFEDNIEVAEDDVSTASEDELDTGQQQQQQQRQHYLNYISTLPVKQRQKLVFEGRWPKGIGSTQIVVGFILTILGLVEVIVLPLLQNADGKVLSLDKHNSYGTGIWAGAMLVLTGAFGVRAAIYKSVSTVYFFFLLVLLNIVVFSGFCLLLLICYTEKWTIPSAYSDDGASFYTHLCVSLLVCIGLVLYIIVYIQFYEDVCCGELQLCRRTCHFCCPCCCPRVAEPEELMSENTTDEIASERPPVLPV